MAKRFKPVFSNNTKYYVTDELPEMTCAELYQYLRESTKVLQLECVLSVGALESTRAVVEYTCMSTGDSTKVTGSQSLTSFDIGMLLADNYSQQFIKDHFASNDKFYIIIEMIYNKTAYYYYWSEVYVESIQKTFPANEAIGFVATLSRVNIHKTCDISFEYCITDDYHSGSNTYGYIEGSMGEYIENGPRNYPKIFSQTYTEVGEPVIFKFGDAGDDQIPDVEEIFVQTTSGFTLIAVWNGMDRDYKARKDDFVAERIAHYTEQCCYSISFVPVHVIRYDDFQPVMV